MPVNPSDIWEREREHSKAMKEDEKIIKKRKEEQQKKKKEESEKSKEEWESHSKEYRTIWRTRLIKVMPGGALDTNMIKLFFGEAFDKIRDLEVEIKELKAQLGFAKEIKKDIKALEVKLNHKEIDTILENLETPG